MPVSNEDVVDPEDLLLRLFSGRRKYPRFQRTLEVRVSFPVWDRRAIAARTIDLSRGGSLVAILDPRIGLAEGIALAQALGTSPRDEDRPAVITFPGDGLRVHVRIVRIVLGVEAGMPLLLGLAFDRELTPAQAKSLGLLSVAGGDAAGQPAVAAVAETGEAPRDE
jgi:hypothetical protein